nr:DUF5753 domain-containing protein [Micromonospora coxensis]
MPRRPLAPDGRPPGRPRPDARPLRTPRTDDHPGYARATLAGGRFTTEEVDRLVTARLERQAVLHREQPPQLIAVVDETVLRRPVLDQPGLMAEQLDHLAELAQREHIQVHVVPTDAGMCLGGGRAGPDHPIRAASCPSADFARLRRQPPPPDHSQAAGNPHRRAGAGRPARRRQPATRTAGQCQPPRPSQAAGNPHRGPVPAAPPVAGGRQRGPQGPCGPPHLPPGPIESEVRLC